MIVMSRNHCDFASRPWGALANYVIAVLLAFSLAGAASQAGAQGAAPNAAHPPSQTSVQMAKQILQIKHADVIFEPVVRGVVIKTRDFFMQTNFMWGKDLNEVADDLIKQYSTRTNELTTDAARIYASHFTEPELKQLLTFYQSPLGQKVVTEEPKAAEESITMAASWADKLAEEIVNKMRAEMKKRGHDI